jgi:SAM-dependent methyltransferase
MLNTDYALKAELYDKYRWDYPEPAIDWIIESCGIDGTSTIADFGAGTGILTRHLSARVRKTYAVEPDARMADILARKDLPRTEIIRKYAHEATDIRPGEVQAILAAHALHWFDYAKTIELFRKVIAPNGFLVSVNNEYAEGNGIIEASGKRLAAHVRREAIHRQNTNTDVYFAPESIRREAFEFKKIETFETFLNGLSSASFYPDASTPDAYLPFREDVSALFQEYAINGKIDLRCRCVAKVGKLA